MSNMGRCGLHGCAFSVRLVNGQRDEYCPECEIDHLCAALATAQAERDAARQEAAAAQAQIDGARMVAKQMMDRLEVAQAALARLQQERDAEATNCRLMQDRLQRLIDGSQAWQQEREGLRDMLGKCGGWVLTRIEANTDEHGECSKCWMQSGTNPECSACRWVADAEAFHKSIVDLLRSTPPTETQEPPR